MDKKSVLRRASKEDLAQVEETEKAKSLEEQVLKRQINWETRYEAKEINRDEKGLIQDYCRQNDISSRLDLLSEKGANYASLFVKILRNIHEKETTQYVLSLIDQFLQESPEQAKHFQRVDGAYDEFIRILGAGDNYCVEKSAKILSVLLSYGQEKPSSASGKFGKWLLGRIPESKGRPLLQNITCLKDFLKAPPNQALVAQEGGVDRLIAILKKESNNAQAQYLVGFCFWLLSFNSECYPALRKGQVVRELVNIVRVSSREKVIRILFATFKNLLNASAGDDHKFNEEMIGTGLHRIVPTLISKGWKDKDIEEDLKVINKTLSVALDELSSFEMYHAEVESGNLQWSPVHSELFWRENINKFEYKNFSLIRRVVELLGESKEETVLEVAAFDLGEFARLYPDGKKILDSFNAKGRLMGLLSHSSAEVRKQALLSVQKLMVQNWEFLSKSAAKQAKA